MNVELKVYNHWYRYTMIAKPTNYVIKWHSWLYRIKAPNVLGCNMLWFLTLCPFDIPGIMLMSALKVLKLSSIKIQLKNR